MDIKLLKKCIVGTNPNPIAAGEVVRVDDIEGKALIAVGYAKPAKGGDAKADEKTIDTLKPEGVKAIAAAPENKGTTGTHRNNQGR